MRFVLPDTLLAALQERRRTLQAARAPFDGVRSPFPSLTRSLGKPDGVDDFVRGMDRLQAEVEAEEDAFLLDPGMGPMTYLTADGRVLLDERSFNGDEVREATDEEAIASLVVGAKKTGIEALLGLIPAPPANSVVCATCAGSRWAPLPGVPGAPVFVCVGCSGRGWT